VRSANRLLRVLKFVPTEVRNSEMSAQPQQIDRVEISGKSHQVHASRRHLQQRATAHTHALLVLSRDP